MTLNLKKIFLFPCIFVLVLIFFYWKDIEREFYFLAYGEKCLISLKNENIATNLKDAKGICNCIIRKIKKNKIKLNTSKLHAYKKIYDENQQKGPIDQVLYKKQCKIIWIQND